MNYFNHAGVIVSNIENITQLYIFFFFWKLHSKSTWLKKSEGARAPLPWMGMTPLISTI